MLGFVQKYRSRAADNELMEKAILANGAIVFLMKENDAKILLSLFDPNLTSRNYRLSGTQVLKLKLFKLWNSAFGNVTDFILHMGLDRLALSIEESGNPDEPLHVIKVALSSEAKS